MTLPDLAGGWADGRDALHFVATHVVARARLQATGRFGLRPLAGGFGTPAFGDDARVVRVSGGLLIDERSGRNERASTGSMPIDGASPTELARFLGLDLSALIDVGHDTPPLGDPARRLRLDAVSALVPGAWLGFVCPVIDAVVAATTGTATVVQLWPEHFDAGLDVELPGGGRVNLGASLGDGFHRDPYLYVGPWGSERPGDPAYWNAPFGAVVGYGTLAGLSAPEATRVAQDFLSDGISRLSG